MKRKLSKYRRYLCYARAELGWQGWKVADKLKMVPNQYLGIERGNTGDHITFITICRLSYVFGLPIAYTFNEEIKYQVRMFKKPYDSICVFRTRRMSWRKPKSLHNYRLYLYNARQKLHYSNEQLSQMIGVARSHYYAIESGIFTDEISFNVLYRVFKALVLDFEEAAKEEIEYLNLRLNGKYQYLLDKTSNF